MKMKKTVRFLRRATALSCAAMTFAFFACNDAGAKQKEKEANVTVWTAYGTEKILRDWDYSARYSSKTLKINAFKHEKESAQIIMSADAQTEYTFEISDLKNENGTVLSKDNFDVYHQKYINLTTIKEPLCLTGAGYYPDAILPYEKAVEYDENFVGEKQNQGIWLTLQTSEEQEAGVYTGTFKVTAGKKTYDVPVSVTLYDYALSDKVHMKTRFSFSPTEIGISEMDTSKEMLETYYEAMLDYRLTPGSLPCAVSLYQMDEYFDYVEKYTKDERVTSVPLIFTGGSSPVELTKEGLLAVGDNRGLEGNQRSTLSAIYWSSFESIILRFAQESVKRETNLCEKWSFYASLIDEYDAHPGYTGLNRAVYNIRRINDTAIHTSEIVKEMDWLEIEDEEGVKKTVIRQDKTIAYNAAEEDAGVGYYLVDLEEPYDIETEMTETEWKALQSELAADMAALRNVTTATKVTDYFYEYADASFCPTIDYYDAEGNRDRAYSYAEKAESEVWTYTAVNPVSPWPTYHTEDVLISSRLLGWMMYEYDIIGNLFWATTLSRKTDGDPQVQDLYEDPIRFPMNGDGYLFYPGRTYGMEEPVPTIRLQSICDSVEDYDLLYELEEFYKERGASEEDFDSVLNFFVDALYTGTRCNLDGDYIARFDASRDLLGRMLELTANTGTVVENYKLVGTEGKFTVSAPVGVTVKQDGKALTGETADGIVTYTVSVPLVNDANYLNLTAEKDGKTYAVDLSLGGRSAMITAPLNAFNAPLNKTLSKDATTDTLAGEPVIKTEIEVTESMQARFNAANLDLTIDDSYRKLVFRVYNYGDGMSLTVRGKAKNSKASSIVSTQILNTGWNEVEIDLSKLNLDTNGALDYISFILEAKEGETFTSESLSLAFDEITLVG